MNGDITLALIMDMFEVFSGTALVGWTNLESGDPPMCVAFGHFFPVEAYEAIRAECIENQADQAHLQLSVRTPKGQTIQCAGVGILDYSAEVGPDGIEINVLGISFPPYEELFPQQVARYEHQFK